MRAAFAVFFVAALAVVLLPGCRRDSPPQAYVTPTPIVLATRAPIALPTFLYTPTPAEVPLPTPSPLDPPPTGNNNSSGAVTGNGSNVGITVSVTPTPAPSPTPTPAVTPSPTISTKHVQTWVYGQTTSNAGSPYTLASPGPWAPYVSYVWSPLFNWAQAMHNAGLKLVLYDNPMQPKDTSGSGPCTASTSTVYDCTLLRSSGTYNSVAAETSGGAIVTAYSGSGIAADPTQAQFAAYWATDLSHECATAQGHYAAIAYDQVFVDNNAGYLGGGFSAVPSTWSISAWGNAFSAAGTNLGTLPSCYPSAHFITNTFGLGDSNQSALINAYLNSSAMMGGMYEGCNTNGYGFVSVADSEMTAISYLKSNSRPQDSSGWVCYVDEQSLLGSSSLQARMFVYGAYLLAYDVHYSTFQESFTSPPSNIQIFPETQFVPLGPSLTPSDPITTSPLCASTCTTSGNTVTGGVFVQYFTNGCYFFGTKVSDNCEVAVNPTGTTNWSTGAVSGGTTQTIPNPNGYAHQMAISGGGTMDGGAVSFSAPSSTTLTPQSAEILVP